MATDLVTLVEHAYQLQASDSAWLREVARAAAPFLDRDAGVFERIADPSLYSAGVFANPDAVANANRIESTLWARVAAHIVAGYRLRRATRALKSGAHCLRDTLRKAAVAVDGKRRRGRVRAHDNNEALDIWRGLVAGQWSLVDHFDSDRRRYLVAVRNTPQTLDPRALTPREREVCDHASQGVANKEIAYRLGLSQSTISGYLCAAMRKLGCASRACLIQVWTGLSGGHSKPLTRAMGAQR